MKHKININFGMNSKIKLQNSVFLNFLNDWT